jgi:hypothetical protein
VPAEVNKEVNTEVNKGVAQVTAELRLLGAEHAALRAEIHDHILLAAGATVDLCPGVADSTVHTVSRVRLVCDYVRDVVLPEVARRRRAGDQLVVLIEFQMGPNAPSRVVATALVALLCGEDVRIVGPSYKNQVYLCDAGRYCHFVAKYKTLYSANKAHTTFNMKYLIDTFGYAPVLKDTPRAAWGHIADAVFQVLGAAGYEDEKGGMPEAF